MRIISALCDTDVIAQSKGISVKSRSAIWKRIQNAILIGVPLAGSVYCPFWFSYHPFGWIEVSCFLLFYLLVGIGIGIGFHRCMTHQSFLPIWPLKCFLLFAGSLACQGSVLRWVADHRRHHRFSDHEWDTHSPYNIERASISSRVVGLWHAHVGWMFDRTTTNPRIYAPDLLEDKTIMVFHYLYWPLTVLSFYLPYSYGFIFGGYEHAIGCLLFGGCFRTTLFHNVVWGVNSFGHMFGEHDAYCRDSSRNNFLLALLTFGEGWHNNHHAIPRSAYNDWKWYQFDLNGVIIRALAALGMVTNVVTRSRIAQNALNEDAITREVMQKTAETENVN